MEYGCQSRPDSAPAGLEEPAARACNSRCSNVFHQSRTKYRIPQPVVSGSGPPVSAKPVATTKPETAKPAGPEGGLVVYEHGKVVFRMPARQRRCSCQRSRRMLSSQERFKRRPHEKKMAESRHLQLPLRRATIIFWREWSPQYPEAAKQQHIQGPVILGVLVGADGSVKDLSVISGDPLLASAATDAVRQWRFKPHQLKGKAVEFETRITVNFALPQ